MTTNPPSRSNGLEADIDALTGFASAHAEAYGSADPFPHAKIDGFIHDDILAGVLDELEDESVSSWSIMDDRFQKKAACNTTRVMGQKTRALIQFLNGQEVITFLETLTGIKGLVPDPLLAGGGLHQLREGGFLGVHADFNFQKHMRLDRRINLLLYLNRDWDEAWGGNLELWDTQMSECVKRYTPEFNRCVVFNTTDKSFHGNPQPVSAPSSSSCRRSFLRRWSGGATHRGNSADWCSVSGGRP